MYNIYIVGAPKLKFQTQLLYRPKKNPLNLSKTNLLKRLTGYPTISLVV